MRKKPKKNNSKRSNKSAGLKPQSNVKIESVSEHENEESEVSDHKSLSSDGESIMMNVCERIKSREPIMKEYIMPNF